MSDYKRAFYEDFMATVHESAQEVVPLVLEFVTPRSVVDVGCGTGSWLATFQRHGVSDVFGIDGPWVQDDLLQIPKDKFRVADLSEPLVADRTYDLVISLETAEHLPERAAVDFVKSLTSFGPVILFSAAIPFQGGYNHVNEQWPDYWAALFAQQRFTIVDCLRPRLWKNSRVEWWYAQNMFLAVSEDHLANEPTLSRALASTRTDQLSVVHPRAFVESAARAKSVSELIQATLGATRRAMKRRVGKVFGRP